MIANSPSIIAQTQLKHQKTLNWPKTLLAPAARIQVLAPRLSITTISAQLQLTSQLKTIDSNSQMWESPIKLTKSRLANFPRVVCPSHTLPPLRKLHKARCESLQV